MSPPGIASPVSPPGSPRPSACPADRGTGRRHRRARGPALVVAGAGAGKTETMAARVVWLVANGLVTPDRVLGLTFTRKAARQLGERVRARLRRLAGSGLLDRLDPGGGRRRLVWRRADRAHLSRLRRPAGRRARAAAAGRARCPAAHRDRVVAARAPGGGDVDRGPGHRQGAGHDHRLPAALAGELAEHLVDPDEIRRHAEWMRRVIEYAPKGPRQRAGLPTTLREIVAAQRFRLALLPLLEAYQRRKRKEAALDFADQMALAAQLASGYPEVAAGERERYGAVLLDEYQDTGHAQRVLLRSLFGGGRTRCRSPPSAIPRRRSTAGGGQRGQPAPVHHRLPARPTGDRPPREVRAADQLPQPARGAGRGQRAVRAAACRGPRRRRAAGPADGAGRATCAARCCRTSAPR